MDRMRLGLTGLGAVFLITLGAAFAFGSAENKAAPENKPGEPLAQLGVAPGAEKGEVAESAAESASASAADAATGVTPDAAPPEPSGTTVVPAPQNEPVGGSLMVPGRGGISPTVSI